MEITILPPQPDEPQITARHAIQSLGQHAESFLAANNLKGWVAEEDYVLRYDRIADLLLMLSASTGLYLGQVKRFARRISKLSQSEAGKIALREALDLVVKSLGYFSYDVAYKCRSADEFIQNFWPQGAVLGLNSLEDNAPGSNANQRVINILLHNYRRNIEQDRQINREELILKDSSLHTTSQYRKVSAMKKARTQKTKDDSRLPLEFR